MKGSPWQHVSTLRHCILCCSLRWPHGLVMYFCGDDGCHIVLEAILSVFTKRRIRSYNSNKGEESLFRQWNQDTCPRGVQRIKGEKRDSSLHYKDTIIKHRSLKWHKLIGRWWWQPNIVFYSLASMGTLVIDKKEKSMLCSDWMGGRIAR